jgi:hypothetical protein
MTVFTPAELAAAAKAEAEHAITGNSTDEQLNAKAQRMAYNIGTSAWVLGQIFRVQREVERLKSREAPHFQDIERRG